MRPHSSSSSSVSDGSGTSTSYLPHLHLIEVFIQGHNACASCVFMIESALALGLFHQQWSHLCLLIYLQPADARVAVIPAVLQPTAWPGPAAAARPPAGVGDRPARSGCVAAAQCRPPALCGAGEGCCRLHQSAC
jgi:hypothetical protein